MCLLLRVEMTDAREDENAVVVQQLRQAAEARLQAMEAAVAASLAQQQELYSSVHTMTGHFMQQKGSDFTELQVALCLECLGITAVTVIGVCCHLACKRIHAFRQLHLTVANTHAGSTLQDVLCISNPQGAVIAQP